MSEPRARGNGLSADSYAPLADLHPHTTGELLDALRDAGIAAYAIPAPSGDLLDNPVTGEPDTGTATDRLYVDAAMKPRAEQILQAWPPRAGAGGPGTEGSGDEPLDDLRPAPVDADHTDRDADRDAGVVERDEDAIWAEIVASFDQDPTPGHGARTPWPEEENLPSPADEPPEHDAGDQGGKDPGQDRSGRLPTARVIKPGADELPDDDELFDDDGNGDGDEGHFVPPPPPPLPSADPTTKGAWIALFGGPFYLLTAAILNWRVPGWAAFLAVAAFVGGFIVLVLRMGDDPRDPDDGAVV